jgi:hypothetical protein
MITQEYWGFRAILREKCKISPCGLLDLQLTHCGIKMNSKVPDICQKNNIVKFH